MARRVKNTQNVVFHRIIEENPKMWLKEKKPQNMVGGVNTPGKRKYQRFETFNQERDTHVLGKEINRKMC